MCRKHKIVDSFSGLSLKDILGYKLGIVCGIKCLLCIKRDDHIENDAHIRNLHLTCNQVTYINHLNYTNI